jgi:hypothetical protein
MAEIEKAGPYAWRLRVNPAVWMGLKTSLNIQKAEDGTLPAFGIKVENHDWDLPIDKLFIDMSDGTTREFPIRLEFQPPLETLLKTVDIPLFGDDH